MFVAIVSGSSTAPQRVHPRPPEARARRIVSLASDTHIARNRRADGARLLVCRQSRSSPSGSPARGSPAATRPASPRRRPAPPRTSPATPRCSRWRRARRASRASATTRPSTAASSSSRTVVRGAIHALAPDDHALYGRALIARDDDELGAQLGQQVQRLAAEKGFAPTDALEEVADATKDALRRRPRARQGRAARRAARARRRRPHAVVRGLQEPPRRADAVALREREGRRAAGLRAPLRPGQARPGAGGRRGGPPLPALLRPGDERGLRRVGRARQAARRATVGRRSRTTSTR